MKTFIVLILSPFLILWRGLFMALAGWQMYQWFLVPMNFPDINGWHIAGIGLFISFLRYKLPETDESAEEVAERTLRLMRKSLIYSPTVAGVTLAVGYLFAKLSGLI